MIDINSITSCQSKKLRPQSVQWIIGHLNIKWTTSSNAHLLFYMNILYLDSISNNRLMQLNLALCIHDSWESQQKRTKKIFNWTADNQKVTLFALFFEANDKKRLLLAAWIGLSQWKKKKPKKKKLFRKKSHSYPKITNHKKRSFIIIIWKEPQTLFAIAFRGGLNEPEQWNHQQ